MVLIAGLQKGTKGIIAFKEEIEIQEGKIMVGLVKRVIALKVHSSFKGDPLKHHCE